MPQTTRYNPVFIDGQPYVVRLLTSAEWDRVIDKVGADDELLHYSKSPSWVQDTRDDWSSRAVVRGGNQARTKDSYSKTDRGPLVGYRPCLEPLDLSTFEPNSSCLSNVKDGELITFGTVRMRGSDYCFSVPKTSNSEGEISHNYGSSPVCISDSVDDVKKNIQWVKVDNLLVADRNLLKNVSWEQLDAWGLVFGNQEKVIGKETKRQSLDALISRAQSISDQSAQLLSDLQKHKSSFER